MRVRCWILVAAAVAVVLVPGAAQAQLTCDAAGTVISQEPASDYAGAESDYNNDLGLVDLRAWEQIDVTGNFTDASLWAYYLDSAGDPSTAPVDFFGFNFHFAPDLEGVPDTENMETRGSYDSSAGDRITLTDTGQTSPEGAIIYKIEAIVWNQDPLEFDLSTFGWVQINGWENNSTDVCHVVRVATGGDGSYWYGDDAAALTEGSGDLAFCLAAEGEPEGEPEGEGEGAGEGEGEGGVEGASEASFPGWWCQDAASPYSGLICNVNLPLVQLDNFTATGIISSIEVYGYWLTPGGEVGSEMGVRGGFNIWFYPDDGAGSPAATGWWDATEQRNVWKWDTFGDGDWSARDTGNISPEGAPIYQYKITQWRGDETDVDILGDYWININGFDNGDGDNFHWVTSGDGDNTHFVGPGAEDPFDTATGDLAFCVYMENLEYYPTSGTPVAGMLGLGLVAAACALGGALTLRKK